MIAPTHIAFALVFCRLFGMEYTVMPLVVLGAVLPDIDHPRSIIGRICLFISIPLNRFFGHRKLIHSMVIWVPITILGFWVNLFNIWHLGWLGLGALTHIFLDCWNTSGLEILTPLSDKIFVLGSRKFRIPTASKSEFIVLVLLCFCLWSSYLVEQKGGIRTMVNHIIGAYDMAKSNYEKSGNSLCYMQGNFRFNNGIIQKVSWPVIGTEERNGLALYDKEYKRIIHIPEDGSFLRVILLKTEEKWNAARLDRRSRLASNTPIFRLEKKKWYLVDTKNKITGTIIYRGAISIKQDQAFEYIELI